MTRIVVDSNVLIDVSRNDARAIAFLESAIDSGEVWSVTPVRTEVLWNLRAAELSAADRMLRSINWLEVTTFIADRAGAFGQQYGRSHGLGAVDAIVAAATEELQASLATLNVRHFPMFPGLQRPY